MVFESHSISKVSVRLVAVNPSKILDAGRNSCASIARCITSVLRASAVALVATRAQVPPRHSRSQVIYDVEMLAVKK
jgi:hypothetical protein